MTISYREFKPSIVLPRIGSDDWFRSRRGHETWSIRSRRSPRTTSWPNSVTQTWTIRFVWRAISREFLSALFSRDKPITRQRWRLVPSRTLAFSMRKTSFFVAFVPLGSNFCTKSAIKSTWCSSNAPSESTNRFPMTPPKQQLSFWTSC